MALAPIEGFRSLLTHHCCTGSLRHVYEFHGYPISEELLLGLGAGLGFVYWHFKGAPPFLGGRANTGRPGEEGLERAAGRRTGVAVEVSRTSSARKAEAALLERLAAGEPTMLQVDMGYLPYLGLPEGYHFGGHYVVAAGYDRETRRVLIADRDEPLHPVTLSDLALARGSKHKPFPPEHAWFGLDFASRRAPGPSEVREAIREVVAGMLEPPISNLGVKGIRKAASAVLDWPRALDAELLRTACFDGFIFVDATGGTGGGIFRYMYGRFLAEAAPIVDDRLAEVGEELRGVGDRWQEAALLFREASEAPDPGIQLASASGLLRELADREERAWTRLREAVG